MTTELRAERVVVGVDGSPASDLAMAWAARYARATGASVRAIMAWHYPSAAGYQSAPVAPGASPADAELALRAELDRAIAAAFGDPPSIQVARKLVHGHPARVLIDESTDADLLVVGSRGHGGFSGISLGSISTHCVMHAACPVTVVRGR